MPVRLDARAVGFARAFASLLATKRYIAGVYDSGSGHLHPLNYTLGLADVASKAGAHIYENTTVTELKLSDPATAITTSIE